MDNIELRYLKEDEQVPGQPDDCLRQGKLTLQYRVRHAEGPRGSGYSAYWSEWKAVPVVDLDQTTQMESRKLIVQC